MGDLRCHWRRVWETTAGQLERGPLSRFLVRFTAAMLAGALVLGAASLWLDEPLRRSMEGEIRDEAVRGYVKPLSCDMKVYDPGQDDKKNIFRRAYEGLVGVVARLLENRERDEAATVAQLRGRIGNLDSSTLQVPGGLIENAFFDAILPGFERQASRSRAWKC